jgi:isoquinoline 1-oxidoreductase subunit beta
MIVKVNRRDFVKLTSVASAGLMLGLKLDAQTTKNEQHALGAFVDVGTDGWVTVYVSKSDMGQGVRTALPMIVAEEMDADWKKVRIRQADLDKKYGRMGTGGSGSIRSMWTPLRQAGATARAMLAGAAAAKWGVDAKEISVANGVVSHGAHKATFGELAAAAAKLEVPKDVALKDPSKFTIIGKKVNRLDNADLLKGKSQYGIDVRVPGMLYAAVLHAPVFGAKVASIDDGKAKQVKGVKHIVRLDPIGTDMPWAGVGVVATSTWAAMKGRDALVVKWDDGPAKDETTEAFRKEMHDLVTKEGKRVRNDGDVDAALGGVTKKLDAVYEVPYLAHATMEPMNATASYTKDGLEMWLPTQFPDWAAGAAGGAVGLKPEQVKVHVTLLGGGFGRRAFPDSAIQAALLSKAAGAPVHLQWTREDDMTHDFYRPASVHRIAAGFDADGKLHAWHHRMASAGINAFMGRGELHESETGGIDDLGYAIPHLRLEYASAKSAVPRGWWRSVENSANAFVVEGFIDELAHAAGKDPIEFHLALLPAGKVVEPSAAPMKPFAFKTDRMRRVIETARDKSGWGKPLPAGRARGFAAWWSFLTYVAQVAEVSVGKDGTPRVHRIVTAIDCGTPVNPDGIAQQVEGSVVYGLSAALKEAITIKGGAVEQSNFHDFELLRIDEMPLVEVHVIPSAEPPSGTGEPGLPPTAPAVGNAIFAATGKRLRELPFKI